MNSLTQAELSELIKLHQKKYRDQSHLFLGEGDNFFSEIKKNPDWVHKIITTEQFVKDNENEVRPFLKKVCTVSTKDISRLSETKTPQPIICVLKDLYRDKNLTTQYHKKVLYLFDIQDPGNCGTLIRSAAWFGWDAVILSYRSVDWKNSKVIRSTMGAFQSVDIVEDNQSFDLLADLTNSHETFRLNMVGSDLTKHEKIKSNNLMIILGNESKGFFEFPSHITNYSDLTISGFPSHVESLNASVAGSLALYEFSR